MFDHLLNFAIWLFGLLKRSERTAGATEERAKINQENAARLERQNEVVNRPVSNEQLQKSLRDGTF